MAIDNRVGAIGDLRELAAALATHERKEHQVLHPMAEHLAGSDGADLAAAVISLH